MVGKPDFQAQMRELETKAASVVTLGQMSGDPTVGVLVLMMDVLRLFIAVATSERPPLTAGQVRIIANAVTAAVALKLTWVGLVAAVLIALGAGAGAYAYAGGFSQICGPAQGGGRVCWWTPR